MERVFLLLLLAVMFDGAVLAGSECKFNSQSGSCEGPQERAKVNRESLQETNQECPIDTVSFIKDHSGQIMCGECIPGYGGWDDPNRFCKLNQYCDDSGRCVDLVKSPFYYAPCPYESGIPGFCGAGLRCYQHVCKPCEDGMIDSIDGKMCINGEWTYSRWTALLYYPDDLALLVVSLNLIVFSSFLGIRQLLRSNFLSQIIKR